MAKVVLQGPRVVAIICELEPTGMAKHVRVDRERVATALEIGAHARPHRCTVRSRRDAIGGIQRTVGP